MASGQGAQYSVSAPRIGGSGRGLQRTSASRGTRNSVSRSIRLHRCRTRRNMQEFAYAGICKRAALFVRRISLRNWYFKREIGCEARLETERLSERSGMSIFGMNHQTKFGQWITWNPNGIVVGYYIAGQNDSD